MAGAVPASLGLPVDDAEHLDARAALLDGTYREVATRFPASTMLPRVGLSGREIAVRSDSGMVWPTVSVMSNLCGIHILDDRTVSFRLRSFLEPRARRHTPTSADWIRQYATAVDDVGIESPAEPAIVDAMIRFEERYGGLCYAPRGGNDNEYGLYGYPTAHWTSHGWAFPGILDGSWTCRVDVLADGRTAMPVPRLAHRVINSSVDQRLEADALLASVYQWPHLVLRTVTDLGVEPPVGEEHLPPRAYEATGPADKWWFDGRSAFNLQLRGCWRTRTHGDTWIVRCFARDGDALDRAASALWAAVPELSTANDDWCSLCARFIGTGRSCLPGLPPAER